MSNQLKQQPSEQYSIKSIVLQKPEPPKLTEKDPFFNKSIPESFITMEFHRKIAIECSRRCLSHTPINSDEKVRPTYENMTLNFAEQLCVNRCVSKIMNVKEIVDRKMLEVVEQSPILYNKNIP